jgi:putative ABC transport system ATP-binding protein
MIDFQNITLCVPQQTLLNSASLRVEQGDKVVVRGASGIGKSTLLKCAVGAIPLQSGTVYVDGVELAAKTVAQIRARIAFVGQEPILGADLVRDALLLPFTFKVHRNHCPSAEKISQQLGRLCLSDDILDKPCKRISGGEKQRIALARALLLGKSIFLADELTSALDPQSRAAVMTELFRPEITLLSVSHDSEWIAACSRLITLENRQLLEPHHAC